MVYLDRIYTRSGDAGETSLADGTRVRKTHPRIAAGGTIDEINCVLGIAASQELPGPLRGLVTELQQELFDLGADLTIPVDTERGSIHTTNDDDIQRLETQIDALNEALNPLTSFILPGGSPAAASLHLARAICRRAELDVLRAAECTEFNPKIAVYLNRLSDLLFVMGRVAATTAGEEVLWVPRDKRQSQMQDQQAAD